MKHTQKSNNKKIIGFSLVLIITVVVGVFWFTRQPARSTEEVAQSYLDFVLQGDEGSANRLTQFDLVCSAPAPYMETEIAKQTAVFAQATIRDLTIETYPADRTNYPETAETADIRFEYQTIIKGPWQPAYLWIVTVPDGPTKTICHVGGSSQWSVE